MKVRLVAMSGVRVENPELLELGLMLPGFVERSEVIASLHPFHSSPWRPSPRSATRWSTSR